MTGGILIQCKAPSSGLTPPHSEPDHTLLPQSTTDFSVPMETNNVLPAAVEKTQDNAAKLTSSSSSIPDSFEQQKRLLHKFGVTIVEDTPVIKVLR